MMESLPQPDSHFRPAPGLTAGERGGSPGPPAGEDALPLGASRGLLGVLVAMAGTIGLAMVIAVVFAVAGVDHIGDNKAYTFIATFAGDFALVAAAWGMTAGEGGRPTLRMFGFRRFRFWSAIGWVALAFFVYLVLAGVYTELVNPPQDKLPDELGANDSALLAVMTGAFVIAVAPMVEEFFFRGFLFQALRNSWGPVLGALGSAVIFAAIHLQPEKFVQLAILGVALAFLFQRTDSLWPCIMLHAFNNILAFAVTV